MTFHFIYLFFSANSIQWPGEGGGEVEPEDWKGWFKTNTAIILIAQVYFTAFQICNKGKFNQNYGKQNEIYKRIVVLLGH